MPRGAIKIEVIPGRGTIFTCEYQGCGAQKHDFAEAMGHVYLAHATKAEAATIDEAAVRKQARLIEPSIG